MVVPFTRLFIIALGFFLPFSCGNPKDQKLSIGDRISGGKILAKIPQSEDYFFLFNANNYNLYNSGSLHIYSRNDLKKPVSSTEIPSFVSTVLTVREKYIMVTFEAKNKETPASLEVWEYKLDSKGVPSIVGKKFSSSFKRSKDMKLTEEEAKVDLVPLSSAKDTKEERFILTCKGGELFVMDLTEEDPTKWKAPVHVRSYGKTAFREALVVVDNMLLLFPSFSDSTLGSFGYDKKEETKDGVPLTQVAKANTLKERTSAYQLVTYDLEQSLQFKKFEDVYYDESFWLSFDLEGRKAGKKEKFFRTNFFRVRLAPEAEENTFYISQRSSVLNEKVRYQILKLKVDELSALRKATKANEGKPEKERAKFDLMSKLHFSEKPLFEVDDDEKKSFAEDPREYKLYDFEAFPQGELEPNFAAVSYNYRSKHYFLLAGKGAKVKRVHEARQTSKSDWELLVWGKDYVTIQNSYKEEAKLISGTFSL